MRTKFLLIIVCFVFVSVAISSCLDSDTQYEFSSDATVHTFALDTIHGKKYKFEIDRYRLQLYKEAHDLKEPFGKVMINFVYWFSKDSICIPKLSFMQSFLHK